MPIEAEQRPTVLVTGAAGNLAARLLPLLSSYRVIGVDFRAPQHSLGERSTFVSLDLGEEQSCDRLARLIREEDVRYVVHMAFVLDPLQRGILDRDRMWRINVAGTARVVEAVAQANRLGAHVKRFIHLSSVSVYGPDLKQPVKENAPLEAHTLAYAVHKKEADEVVRQRAESMGECELVVLRPHIFTGASMQNYMVNALRGTAYGNGSLGRRMQRKHKRLPLLAPRAQRYLTNKLQFVHVDDVARVVRFFLDKPTLPESPLIVNVAAKGEPLTFQECAQLTDSKIVRLPTRALCRLVVKSLWNFGASSIPPDAFPFLIGSYAMDTTRLRQLLGSEYDRVIRYDNREALMDSFRTEPDAQQASA